MRDQSVVDLSFLIPHSSSLLPGGAGAFGAGGLDLEEVFEGGAVGGGGGGAGSGLARGSGRRFAGGRRGAGLFAGGRARLFSGRGRLLRGRGRLACGAGGGFFGRAVGARR